MIASRETLSPNKELAWAQTSGARGSSLIRADETPALLYEVGTIQLKKRSATVSVAPVGVPPTGSMGRRTSPKSALVQSRDVFGGTPKTAGETPALPR